MKKFFQSFYGKLSMVFLLILLVLGIVQVLITTQSLRQYTTEVDQKLNLNLARDMANELTSLLKDEIDFEEIGHRIHYMMVMNPKVEIYLLDGKGKILAFFAEPGKTVQKKYVDLDPILQFLSNRQNIPILGDDPRQPGKKKPFSASRLAIGENKQGYMYIIIGGEEYDTTATMLRESYILKTTIKGLFITVFFAGIIGLILFALLTKRLRSISEVVTDFEKGNSKKRIHFKSSDEFGQLGASFNQMADTIVANMEELKQTDNLRRELIANVSHDLRSPLASIQGYLETILMKDAALSPEERKHYLNIILNNAQMLSNLVYELFELSKLDAKQVQPQPEPFSIAELAQDVVMKFKTEADQQKIELTANFRPDLPHVNADIAMIERTLTNLIDNAIHHTRENGVVKVDLRPVEDKIRVEVQDNGYGIPEKDLPHIFDRFYKCERKNSEKSASTGLGLAIAKKIIDLHDSTIAVESKINEGSRFYFDLTVLS